MWALRLNVTHTLSLSLLFSLTHTHTLPLTHALSQCELRNASFNTSFSSYPPTRAHITYKFFCKVKGNKTCSNFFPRNSKWSSKRKSSPQLCRRPKKWREDFWENTARAVPEPGQQGQIRTGDWRNWFPAFPERTTSVNWM